MNALGYSLVCLLLSATSDRIGVPLGIPPLPEDPVLACVASENCLFYTSWTGAGSPDAKSRSQTEQLLAEPEMQHLFKQIEAGIGKIFDDKDPKAAEENVQLVEGAKMVLYHPTAIFVSSWKFKTQKESEEGGKFELNYDALKVGFVCSLGKDVDRFKTDWDTYVKVLTEPVPADDLPADGKKDNEKKEDSEKADGEQNKVEKAAENTTGEIVTSKEKSKEENVSGEKSDDNAKANEEEEFDPIIEKIEIEGQPWLRIQFEKEGPKVDFGFHEGYFIAACGEKVAEEILERMKKQETPNWWKAIGKQTPIERRSTVTYLDLKAIRELLLPEVEPAKQADVKAIIEMIGLANASSLTEVSGLEGEDFIFKTRLNIEGESQGLLQLVSEKPLKAEELASIPRDSTLAMAARLDLKQAIEIVQAAAEKMNPTTKESMNAAWELVEKTLDINVRRELIGSLGDTWCIYNSPGEGGLIATGMTAVVPLRDKETFTQAYGKMMETTGKKSKQKKPDLLSYFVPMIMQFRFDNYDIYSLTSAFPVPSWCVTEKEVIFSLTPQNIKAFLSRGTDYQPLGQTPGIVELFEGEKAPVALGYIDTPKLFELGYPLFTSNASSLISLLNLLDVDADFGTIPSQIAIGRHLRPTKFILNRSKDGLELTTRGTFPTSGPLLTCGILAGLYFDGDLDDAAEELTEKK